MKLTMWRSFCERQPSSPFLHSKVARWENAAKVGLRSTQNKHDIFRENQMQSLNKHARLVEHEFL